MPLLLEAGGKPSTWLPPGGLVEQKNLLVRNFVYDASSYDNNIIKVAY